MGAVTFAVHTALTVFYGYSTYVYVWGVHPPEELQIVRESHFGPFKYLTFWDLLLQLLFFSLCIINHLLCGTKTKQKSSFTKLLDFMFAALVFPCASFVCISFWSIFSFNRELIFPVIFDSFFPCWLNHGVHSLPLFAVLFELLSSHRTFPSQRKGFVCVALFTLLYLGWVMYIASTTGHWVYPVLAHLNSVGRAGFIAAMCVLIGIFYILGDLLQSLRWGKEQEYEELILHKKK